MFFRLDQSFELHTGVRISRTTVRYRYGTHNGFNPIYTLAKNLFDKPEEYEFCFKDVPQKFRLKKDYSNDWWYRSGWNYDLDSEEFINNFPRDQVTTEALLVEGNCAESYNDNNHLAKFDLYYEMPELDSYRNAKLKNKTFNKVFEEVNSRIEYDAGYTQLRRAIVRDSLDDVKKLVSSGVSVNAPFSGDQGKRDPQQLSEKKIKSPLKIALVNERDEIVEYLIERGAKHFGSE
ncbi:MAG: hypothetical protein ACR2QW_05175 [bacterium]